MNIHIGTSGFVYDHWGNGIFYPSDIPKTKWLEYYTGHFDTVEINSTFYRLPSIQTVKGWYERTPRGFIFVLKGSRYITHIRRLTNCKESLEAFFERANALKEKLLLILWQFPPGFSRDSCKLKDFIKPFKRFLPVRHAFEFRNKSWFCKEIYDILKERGLGLCQADWPEMPGDLPVTSDFLYLRRHGGGASYSSSYSIEELKRDAEKILVHAGQGKEIFVFFNNDVHGYAIKNAKALKDILGLSQLVN